MYARRDFAASFFLLLPLLVGGAAKADNAITTPQVVETTPTLQQFHVSPELPRIEVRFDQPMTPGSWSWCGGGDHFPEIIDKSFFRDEYTCVLPVKLKPQTTYILGINCPSARNFRGANGLPATAMPLAFVTGSGAANIAARSDNYRAWESLTSQFTTIYSYYDRTGTDWKKVFNDAKPAILESPTVEEFVLRAAMVLSLADDPHLALKMPDGNRVGTNRRHGFYNANQQVIEREFAPLTKHNNLVWSGKRGPVGYLAVHGWNNANHLMDPIQDVMKDMSGTTLALIVDVRGNGGGDEDEASRLARWFIDHDAMYAKHRFRSSTAPDGWEPLRERWIAANPPEKRYRGKVFLLQGSVCLSSNEAFIEMMKQSPRVTSIGATTGGSSANPRSYDLPNGAKIVIPRWQSFSTDGVLLEGRGIPPDLPIDGDFGNSDPVLEKALQLAAEEMANLKPMNSN